MKTPFFGPAYVARSTNVGDNDCINLFGEIVEIPGAGKDVGALYNVPGKTLLATVGSGPIRGMQILPSGTSSLLWIVSGTSVYTVDSNYNVTTIGGTILGSGPVYMIPNQTQMAIFTASAGFIVPGGVPLTGGTIATAGSQYTIGDKIFLNNNDGTQTATASLTVTNVAAGAVTAFTVDLTGAFGTQPTGFTQLSTTGSGAGFTLSFPIYGANVPVYRITLPFTPNLTGPITGAQQDGFALINQPGSYVMWQSNELDFSVWNGLAFASASGDPDNIVVIFQMQLEMYIIKRRHTEIWYNAGTSPFLFQRATGTYIEVGCLSPASAARAGNALLWLSETTEGESIVVSVTGYVPTRVSTHAMEYEISQYSTLTDAQAFTYQQDGHSFYQLTFPTANVTWVLDLTETAKAGFPMWHKRGEFSAGQIGRDLSNAYVFFNQTCVVGDYQNGNIYSLDTSNLTSNGNIVKRVRSWRALPDSKVETQRFSALQMVMQTGIGVSGNPQCMLEWSDDGGHTWTQPMIGAVGQIGQTAARIKFNRLGSTRRNSGLDRIFRWSATDAFPTAITSAELM